MLMFHAAVVVQCSALAEGLDLVELCPPLPCGLMVRYLTHNITFFPKKIPVTAVPVCNLRAAACNSAVCARRVDFSARPTWKNGTQESAA